MTPLFAAGGSVELDVRPEVTLALIFALLAFSFFFSGTETALFSLQKVDRKRFARSGWIGRRIATMLKRRAALISTILVGNESVNVALAATGAGLVHQVWPDSPWVNVLIVTPTLVFVSEITPKVLAFRYNKLWAQVAIIPLTIVHFAITPIRLVVVFLVSTGARLFLVDGSRSEGLGEHELLVLVDHGHAAGEFDQMERDIIEAVFDFDALTVERIMTPRPDVFAVPLDIGWEELLERCREAGRSRIPVHASKVDDIVGVLLLKDLLKHRQAPLAGPRQLRSLLMPPVFVPASKAADDMLAAFRERRFHMAFVVDEHGTFIGLVTLDDLLNELIGELPPGPDDSEVAHIRQDRLRVAAAIDLEDFTEETGISLPEGDYHTLAGFVFHQLGRLPRRGDTVEWEGNRFLVRSMEGRRIAEIEVEIDPQSSQEAV